MREKEKYFKEAFPEDATTAPCQRAPISRHYAGCTGIMSEMRNEARRGETRQVTGREIGSLGDREVPGKV